MAKTQKFFTKEQQETIKQAIVKAEHETSGEIRVHIENNCPGDAVERATLVFHQLKMHNTVLHNGVLFYLAISHRKFAILGDAGINEVVPENFWDDVKEHMQQRFRNGKFTEGLSEAIAMAGEHLKKNFPHQKDDVNELSDDISFGKE